MHNRPFVALLRATPATVLDDYRRLLNLAEHAEAAPQSIVAVFPYRHSTLPGERAEPWQLDGTLRALAVSQGVQPAVALAAAGHADPLAAVAHLAGVPLVAPGTAAGITLCGAGQVPQLAKHQPLQDIPARLFVVDATTVCRGSGETAQFEIRGVLLASNDIAALAYVTAAVVAGVPASINEYQERFAILDLRGDTALVAERWSVAAPRTPPRKRLALLDRLAAATRRSTAPAQRAYEDWVFHTGWGRLYRTYQRRALAYRSQA